jgi:hypothetical protein
MSETGWASYLDKEAGQSYAMNERPSKASDGYYTPDVFSNPVDVAKSWVASMQGVIKDPLEAAFMTISNDTSGRRSWGKGTTEVDARTIKPKVKTFEKDMRVTGIQGINVFGAPGSKPGGLPAGFGEETPKAFFGGASRFIAEKSEEFGLRFPSVNVAGWEGPQLPKVDLPKVDLPKVELPEIELPAIPNPFAEEQQGKKK